MPIAISVGLAGALGAAFGSFLNVVAYRVPRRESLLRPRSRCPDCGTPISGYDNVPVISWALLRGRCRRCQARISPRYPAVEALTAGLAIAAVLLAHSTYQLVLSLTLILVLVPVALIDLDHRIIPNRITLPAAIAAIVIGAVAGVIVVAGVLAIDRYLDDPVGALPAHGLAGIWGTLSCGLVTGPALAKFNGVGQGGLFYTGSLHQLGAQIVAVTASFVTVFALSYGLFALIRATVGLRVSAREEMEGLDISEHGMWGYPEAFMPVPGGVYRPAEFPTVNPHAEDYAGALKASREAAGA